MTPTGVGTADPTTHTGSVPIAGLDFVYDATVLRPRPWTRAQSEWARELLPDLPDGPVLELCSGVGHIGLLALDGHERPLVAVDADAHACALARHNAAAAGLLDRVDVRCAPINEALEADERFPLVIADPPWVPSAEVARFPDDPVACIDGGPDGLDLARACLEVAARHLVDGVPGGRCLLQVGGTGHVIALTAWLGGPDTPALTALAVRDFGERGALVLLAPDQAC